jgi:deoxycytidine triphosphate deaminase
MTILRDDELIDAVTSNAASGPWIAGVDLPTAPADRYSSKSPIQASSIDLRIGNVYLPGEEETDLGGAKNPRESHTLETGETAVVTSMETLQLPSDIAGFGFPPSSVSFKGLLMTNPGHVDPGYTGVMRFTVINMAKDPYPLERGQKIATLLLFRLNQPSHADWRTRNPAGSALPNHAAISRLSRDFVDVEKRAEDAATRKGVQWSVSITAGAALLLGVIQLFTSGSFFSRSDVAEMKKRQDAVEYDIKNRVNIELKIEELQSQMKDLEVKIAQMDKTKPPAIPPGPKPATRVPVTP